MAANDPRTVKVRHPKQGTHKVTPEVAAVLDRQGWERVGAPASEIDAAVEQATAPLHTRLAELEAQVAAKQAEVDELSRQLLAAAANVSELEEQRVATAPIPGPSPVDVPDKHDEAITWIGNDRARAEVALEAEKARPVQRKTVTDHITSVLNPTTPPPADNTGGQSAKED